MPATATLTRASPLPLGSLLSPPRLRVTGRRAFSSGGNGLNLFAYIARRRIPGSPPILILSLARNLSFDGGEKSMVRPV